jgi:hypothetical protein
MGTGYDQPYVLDTLSHNTRECYEVVRCVPIDKTNVTYKTDLKARLASDERKPESCVLFADVLGLP